MLMPVHVPFISSGASSFPVIESSASTVRNSPSATDWGSQNMPSGIATGDLLLAFAGIDGVQTQATFGTTATTAWTRIAGELALSRQSNLSIAYKVADGGGTDDLSITIDATEQGAVWVLRVSGHDSGQAPELSAYAEGSSTSPDPASLSPTGGAKDYLWIAVTSFDTNIVVSSAPTSYSSAKQAIGGTSSGHSCTWASRELNTASEDPGTFTFASSDDWVAYTIAVHPM